MKSTITPIHRIMPGTNPSTPEGAPTAKATEKAAPAANSRHGQSPTWAPVPSTGSTIEPRLDDTSFRPGTALTRGAALSRSGRAVAADRCFALRHLALVPITIDATERTPPSASDRPSWSYIDQAKPALASCSRSPAARTSPRLSDRRILGFGTKNPRAGWLGGYVSAGGG